MDFFYYSVCHLCKAFKLDLKKCSKCKTVHYCCREHQILDWPFHKELCRVISDVDSLSVPASNSAADFMKCRQEKPMLWQFALGRNLALFEQQMWMHPKVCIVCFKSDVQIICNNCGTISYCSEEHKNLDKTNHEKFCDDLKLSMQLYLKIYDDKDLPRDRDLHFKKDVYTWPETVKDVIHAIKFSNGIDYSQRQMDLILLSDLYGPVMNMIAALQQSKFIENRRAKKKKLTILVICHLSDQIEKFMLWIEMIAHWICNLKKVKVFSTGPGIIRDENIFFTPNCAECTRRKFVGNIIAIEGNFQASLGILSRPDLIAVLDNIPESKGIDPMYLIPTILLRNVPVVVTSYSLSQVESTVSNFQSSQIQFYKEPQVNPYGSLRPLRRFEREMQVLFQNKFYASFVKK